MKDPAFKLVFGSEWEKLPPVFQKRYMNRAFSDDVIAVQGEMEIQNSKVMTYFVPFFKLFRVLVPYQGKNIPVKVDFQSSKNSVAVCLDRYFYFPDKKPWAFHSCMYPLGKNDVLERMAFGLGWRTHYFYDGKKVVMQHRGYVLQIFGINIPLPLTIFLGKGYAEEVPIDDDSYQISMTMTHPWWGVLYTYSGQFTFKGHP